MRIEKKGWTVKMFALVVMIMFMTSGVTIAATEPGNEEEEEVDYTTKELTDDDYSNPNAYPKIFSNPKFDPNNANFDPNKLAEYGMMEKYANQLNSDQIPRVTGAANVQRLAKALEPDSIYFLTPEQVKMVGPELKNLKPEQKKGLVRQQLKDKEVLANVGDLGELNQQSIEGALQDLHNVDFQIVVAAGVTYKDGVLFNQRFLFSKNLEELKKSDKKVVALVAVANPSTKENGWTIITEKGQYQTITAEEIGTIAEVTIKDGKTVITNADKTEFTIEQGKVASIIDEQGRRVFVSTEGTIVSFGNVEFMAEGSKGKETKFDFTKEDSVRVEGPVRVTSKGKIEGGGTGFEGAKIDIKLDKNKDIESVSAQKATFYFNRLLDGKRVSDGTLDGNFEVKIKDGGISEFTLRDKEASANIYGVGVVKAGDRLPLTATVRTTDGKNPATDRLILDANGAAIAQLSKIKQGMSSFKTEVYEKLARDGKVELQVYELEGTEVKTTTVTCRSRAECNTLLDAHYNVQKLDKVMEKLNVQQGSKSTLYLTRFYDSKASQFELGDAAGRGTFKVENEKYGRIETTHASSTIFYRSEPDQRAFYIDSHEDNGNLGRIKWNVPVTKGDRTIKIFNNRLYEVAPDGKIYEFGGKEPVDAEVAKQVKYLGKDPAREFAFEKKDGRTEAKLNRKSVLEEGLYNSALEGDPTINYLSDRNIKLYHQNEPSQEDIQKRIAVSNVVEINPITNRISLAMVSGEFAESYISKESDISGAAIQNLLEVTRKYKSVAARELDFVDVNTIVNDLKQKGFSGQALERELARRGIRMEITAGKESYRVEKGLIESEIRGYLSPTILTNKDVGLITKEFRESVGKDSAYGSLFEGIQNSEFGYKENAIQWFEDALKKGLNKPTGIKAIVDEVLKKKGKSEEE